MHVTGHSNTERLIVFDSPIFRILTFDKSKGNLGSSKAKQCDGGKYRGCGICARVSNVRSDLLPSTFVSSSDRFVDDESACLIMLLGLNSGTLGKVFHTFGNWFDVDGAVQL